jgi:hypothetical protein
MSPNICLLMMLLMDFFKKQLVGISNQKAFLAANHLAVLSDKTDNDVHTVLKKLFGTGTRIGAFTAY